MKVVKLNEGLYKKAEKVSRVHGVKINDLITQAISEGIEVLSERNVVGLYRDHKITLQKAAEMLEVVCNASPLIFLAKIDRLNLLDSYVLRIPSQVESEILKGLKRRKE